MIKCVFFLGYTTSWVIDNVQLIKYDRLFATGSDAVQGSCRSACRITCSSPLAIRGGGLANDWRRLCTVACNNLPGDTCESPKETRSFVSFGDSHVQCMKRPVAHSLNSTWFWIELPENCCEPLKFIMKYISIQFCERPGHGRPFHALHVSPGGLLQATVISAFLWSRVGMVQRLHPRVDNSNRSKYQFKKWVRKLWFQHYYRLSQGSMS